MLRIYNIINTSVTVLAVTLFFSCQSNFKDIQKINVSEFMASGEADSVNLKYTDSGKIKAILVSPKMMDYGTVLYPFTEFPDGIEVTLYDQNGKHNFIKSDYAITYKGTDIIDMQGNVKMTAEGGQYLETDQLYYDQKNEWFFTEKKFKFTNPDNGETKGDGLDFSKDFKRINFQKVSGVINEAE